MSVASTTVTLPVIQRVETDRVSPNRRLWAWLAAVAATMLTTAVAIYRADDRQLWGDELATWHAVATLGMDEFWRLIGHMDLAVAPYYLAMRAWVLLVGDTELALRMPSIIAMGLTAGLTTLLGRRLISTRVGVIAALLFATLPSVSRYGQEARAYSFTMLLVVLATLFLLRALRRPTWPRWILYGVVLVLLGFSHIVALTILAAHAIVVRHVAREMNTLRPWRWIGSLVLVISVVGPFSLSIARQAQAISWVKADKDTIKALPAQLFGSEIVATIIVVAAGTGIYLTARSTGIQLPLLTSWTLIPPVFTLVSFPLLHLFQYRYLLFTIPAWTLLAAIGICAAGEKLVLSRRKVGGATIAALLTLPAVAWASIPGHAAVRDDTVLGSPDYRSVARVISADLRPGDAIAFGGFQQRARIGLAYAMRDRLKPRDAFLLESAASVGWYSGRECPMPANCLGPTLRIWLVNTSRSNDPFAEMPPLRASLLKERFTTVEQHDFSNVRLTLFVLNQLIA